MESLQATDLVVHTIPTYPCIRPHRPKEPIYAANEIHWQVTMLLQMLKGGIICQVNDKGYQIDTTRGDQRTGERKGITKSRTADNRSRYKMPRRGDLVLRRRFVVKTKWDGPCRLSRISRAGVSGDLQDKKKRTSNWPICIRGTEGICAERRRIGTGWMDTIIRRSRGYRDE